MDATPLFGRVSELKRLRERIQSPGLTLVTGPPRIGKSALLRKFVADLDSEERFLVGYSQGTTATNELLLSSLADLYTRYIQRASFSQQAKTLLKKRKGRIIPAFGKTFAAVISPILNIQDPSKIASTAVKNVFSGLASLNEDLKSPDLGLTPISYDQTLALVQLLNDITGETAILVLDAFEQLLQLRREAGTITTFLKDISEWPACHLILSLRDSDPENDMVQIAEVWDTYPLTESLRLGEMGLDDENCKRQVVSYLRQELPNCCSISDDVLLTELQNDPAILERWVCKKPNDYDELVAHDRDARNQTYEDLRQRFREMLRDSNAEARQFSCRLALMPEIADVNLWHVYEPVVSRGISKSTITNLQTSGVLDFTMSFPSFGHTTRYESARDWWLEYSRAKPIVRNALDDVIKTAAARIDERDENASQWAAVIFALGNLEYKGDIWPEYFPRLCLSIGCLFGVRESRELWKLETATECPEDTLTVTALAITVMCPSSNKWNRLSVQLM